MAPETNEIGGASPEQGPSQTEFTSKLKELLESNRFPAGLTRGREGALPAISVRLGPDGLPESVEEFKIVHDLSTDKQVVRYFSHTFIAAEGAPEKLRLAIKAINQDRQNKRPH